ncbi:MAG: MMPL family transporter [Fibrobacterales bacterium]
MKKLKNTLSALRHLVIDFSIQKPKAVTGIMLLLTTILLLLAALPSIAPETFPGLNALKVDTDPENMLPDSEPARLFHKQMNNEFNLNEFVGIGVVNETHPNGIYNKNTLAKVDRLTQFAKNLQWAKEDGSTEGIVAIDIMAPSLIDNIKQNADGGVQFELLLPGAPTTEAEALTLKQKVEKLPFLQGSMFANNGKALALMLPMSDKKVGYQVYQKLLEEIKSYQGDGDVFHIAGLPVAKETFGVEMFSQMAIAAPASMFIIFLLMLFFFRKVRLILSPMIVAMVSIIMTMGLLVISGNTIHIMSSMIPIFIMPIAVLNAVHILSDFFEEYQKVGDRKKTIELVMTKLFSPMLFTSLTTVAGFASLALTPNPPVQVFGIFVALGVGLAWLWTILFIPSYIMMMPEDSLKDFGTSEDAANNSPLNKVISKIGSIAYTKKGSIIVAVVVLIVLSVIGIKQIVINDNPTLWFASDHPLRIADKELNKHLSGTYSGYLALHQKTESSNTTAFTSALKKQIPQHLITPLLKEVKGKTLAEYIANSETAIEEALDSDTIGDSDAEALDEAFSVIDAFKGTLQTFKNPEVLNYVVNLQKHIETVEGVGKVNGLTDLVQTVYREMHGGDSKYYSIPETQSAVAQSLTTYQSSHRPQDLWHFVTPDYSKANLWVQLQSGNNTDMQRVVTAVDSYIAQNPLPAGLEHNWFGLTYINLIWQENMVSGMLSAFIGSFIIVMIMMIFLFRSFWWGILSMIPLSVTIVAIYGIVGFIGKDFDMPVAVLSSLSLGLAIDYAIHFIVRSKQIAARHESWDDSIEEIFQEPARAIVKNVFVVGIGFLPLLLSPLVPYKTVGIFIASILIFAGAASIIILPALITLFQKQLFKNHTVNTRSSDKH